MSANVAPWRDDPRYVMKPDKQTPSRSKIENDMRRKWEGVLYFLVGSDAAEAGVAEPLESVVHFMEQVQHGN